MKNESSYNNNYKSYNQNIIEFKEEYNNNNNIFKDDEDDIELKTKEEIMYDLIQDSYTNIKNSLLILRKRLINNQDISQPLNDSEVRNFLNIKNINNSGNQINSNLLPKKPLIKHSKYFYDNMIYKIKVLYHKFIVSLTNDIYNNCIKKDLNNIFVRKISAQITQNLTKGFNKDLANLTLKEFLSKSISLRYLNTSENANRENLENIYIEQDIFQPLINFLKYTYKDLYQKFYIKENCIELIEGNFNVKKRTYISFKESLEKFGEKQNKDYIDKLIEFANDKFILFLEGKKIKNIK